MWNGTREADLPWLKETTFNVFVYDGSACGVVPFLRCWFVVEHGAGGGSEDILEAG